MYIELGGGFTYCFLIFTPTWGNDPIWRDRFFSNGWLNHQLVQKCCLATFLLGSEAGHVPGVGDPKSSSKRGLWRSSAWCHDKRVDAPWKWQSAAAAFESWRTHRKAWKIKSLNPLKLICIGEVTPPPKKKKTSNNTRYKKSQWGTCQVTRDRISPHKTILQ